MQPDPDFAQASDEQRAIPFDYTFRFDLEGEPDRLVRSIVTVSVEASFIAVSIGYGIVPKLTPVIFGPEPSEGPILELASQQNLRDITIGSLLDALNTAPRKRRMYSATRLVLKRRSRAVSSSTRSSPNWLCQTTDKRM
jgi:hypothetical protein